MGTIILITCTSFPFIALGKGCSTRSFFESGPLMYAMAPSMSVVVLPWIAPVSRV